MIGAGSQVKFKKKDMDGNYTGEWLYGIVQSLDPVYATIDVDNDEAEEFEMMLEEMSQKDLSDMVGDAPLFISAVVLVGDMEYSVRTSEVEEIEQPLKSSS